jgi:hypothetical protein
MSNSRFPLVCFITFWSLCWLHSLIRRPGGNLKSDSAQDDVEGLCEDKASGTTPKRRALLVGISYEHSPRNEHTGEWEVLEGVHTDIDHFRDLLISAYSSQHLAGCHFPWHWPLSQKPTDTPRKTSLFSRTTPTSLTSFNLPV